MYHINSINLDETLLFEVLIGKRDRRTKIGDARVEGEDKWAAIYLGTDPKTQDIYRTKRGKIKLNIKDQKNS